MCMHASQRERLYAFIGQRVQRPRLVYEENRTRAHTQTFALFILSFYRYASTSLLLSGLYKNPRHLQRHMHIVLFSGKLLFYFSM